jgi:hypothetical protein
MYTPSPESGPLRQSEILSNIVQHVLTLESVGTDQPQVILRNHPLAIVASQDCDLDQDFTARNIGKPPALPSILFFEVTPAMKLAQSLVGSDLRRRLVTNKEERYQVLQQISKEQDAQGEGLVSLGIDFKRYFTVPTEEVYKQLVTAKRRCFLTSPYAEHFSIRAILFQCRIALPVDHHVPLSGTQT